MNKDTHKNQYKAFKPTPSGLGGGSVLLIHCWLLLPLWESVSVLCFVVRYFMSILVLQSSWWGWESRLLCWVGLPGVSWLLYGSSLRCHGFVCSLWMWYFLIMLAYYFQLTHISISSFLWDKGKQCRPRSAAAEHGAWSGSLLFACRMFYELMNKNEKYHPTPLSLSHDFGSGSDITLCNNIDKPLVVYRYSGNVMMSVITLRKRWQNLYVFKSIMWFSINFNVMW